MLNTEQQQKAIGTLLRRKENSLCADCNGKSPCWASLDFGVFVCMNCSGAHRNLGPSITRVKSTKLDTWNRDWLQNMQIGNSVLNQYWQYSLTGVSTSMKPNINTSLSDIIKFVQDKYVKKRYVDPTQKLDPLKRMKMGQIVSLETIKQKDPIMQVRAKQPAKAPKIISSVESKPSQSIFAHFDTIVQDKKRRRKSSDNLISFQEGVMKSGESHNLMGFDQTETKQTKYDKNQFYSMSDSKPAQNNFNQPISYDSHLKPRQQSDGRGSQHSNNSHNNYFLGQQNFNQNTNHIATNHYSQSTPQFDKNQYVTMNINMNMYPKVMNINMNMPPNYPNFQNHQQGAFHTMNYGTLPGNGYNTNQQQNTGFNLNQNGGFGLQQDVLEATKKSTSPNITLASDINLNKTPINKEEPTSWIDDWK